MPKELILANVAAMLVNEEYSTKEKQIIKEITKSGSTVDVVIPDTINADEFDVALSAVCKVISRAEMQKEGLIPVLGRLLYIASQHPEVYEAKYPTFDELVASISERFGVGRSTCFEAKSFWSRWSAVLPPEEYRSVGRVKMNMISGAVEKGAESQKQAAATIQFAKEHTASELEDYIEKKFGVEKGTTTGAVLKIPSNKKQNKLFVKFFDDDRVQAYCGTERMAEILELMIAEVSNEWFIQGQGRIDKLAGQAEVLNAEEVPAEA